MTHPLINDKAAAWLNELRTTTRPKAMGNLRDAKGCSCALGDAVLLAYPEDDPHWVQFAPDCPFYLKLDDEELFNMLPEQLARDLGLICRGGSVAHGHEGRSVWSMSDCTEMTKAEIADHIEANAELYFVCPNT